MTTPNFRVTVEDLDTGDKAVTELFLGDYLLIPFGDCHLAHTQANLKAGIHVLTIKGYAPKGQPRAGGTE